MMTKWIIYLVAASQIIVFYWLTASSYFRLIDGTFFNKNAGWIKDNPAFKERFARRKYSIWLSYFLGTAWLALLFFFGSDPKPGTRIFTLLVPTFAWLILVLGYTCVAYHRVCKKIPLPTKRSANFERRALRDFVPPFWTILCYLLYAVAIGVYIVAIRTELIPMQVFVGRMIGFVIILVTGTSTLLYCLRRKKQAIDDAWGPFYRKMEVTGNIILLYGCLLVVAWGMLRDFFSVSLFGEAAYFFAMLNVLMQLAWVTFMTRPAVKRLLASGQ